MTFGEAIRLTKVLAAEPDSHIASALGGWEHPLSRADITLRDLYDMQHASKARRRPEPYPRPWDRRPERVGSGAMTVAQYRAMRESMTKEG